MAKKKKKYNKTEKSILKSIKQALAWSSGKAFIVVIIATVVSGFTIYKYTPKDTPEYYWHPKEEAPPPVKKAEKSADELNRDWYNNNIFE